MRESIGNTLLLNIVIIFSGIVILIFIGIISYSKAYRVKNRIVEIVEKYEGYTTCENNEKCAVTEINESLKGVGYSTISKDFCSSNRVQNHLRNEVGIEQESGIIENLNNNIDGYNYCVFEVGNKATSVSGSDEPKYYIVVTFVHFNFPVVGDMINIPVYGETKILGRNYNY